MPLDLQQVCGKTHSLLTHQIGGLQAYHEKVKGHMLLLEVHFFGPFCQFFEWHVLSLILIADQKIPFDALQNQIHNQGHLTSVYP